jgi:hypothetical protein
MKRAILALAFVLTAVQAHAAGRDQFKYEPERGAQLASLKSAKALHVASLKAASLPLWALLDIKCAAPLTTQGCSSGSGSSTIVSGTTAISGGGSTQACYNQGGFIKCGDAGFTYNESTDSITVVGDAISGRGVFGGLLPTDANVVSISETAGCITFEGSTSDTIQTRLCALDPTSGDTTTSLPNAAVASSMTLLARRTDDGGLQNGSTSNPVAMVGWFPTVEAVTATKTTSLRESGEIYTNTGDTDGATITLVNDPTVGVWWRFAVTAAQTLTIVANTGETLKHGSSTCGTSLTSSTVGSTIEIWVPIGGSGGSAYTFGATGTWTCNA